jgi:hypothetical protein
LFLSDYVAGVYPEVEGASPRDCLSENLRQGRMRIAIAVLLIVR